MQHNTRRSTFEHSTQLLNFVLNCFLAIICVITTFPSSSLISTPSTCFLDDVLWDGKHITLKFSFDHRLIFTKHCMSKHN